MPTLIDLGGGLVVDRDKQLLALDRVDCEESLAEFVRHFWHVVEHATPLRWGWTIDAICEHLEAVTYGDLTRLLINVPPGSMKPVSKSALISTKRGLIPLREIVVGDEVLTHKGRFRPVTAVHDQGEIPVLKITTRAGRQTTAAHDHPFLTPEGWRELGKIKHQDVVGVVPQYEVSGSDTMSLETARLLGYLIGDGACGGTPNITVADDIESDDIEHCIRACGFTPLRQSYKMANNGYELRRISIKAADGHIHRPTTGYRGPVRQFMEKYGIRDKSSYTKMIPDEIMRGSNEIACAFISAYWACDGYISMKAPKRNLTERDDLKIGCDSVNETFIRQMQTLLLRLGVGSLLRKKTSNIKTKKQGEKYTSW